MFVCFYNILFTFCNIRELSNFQWKPLGKNVPKISLINLSHKKAWDIGKEVLNIYIFIHL
ncbi:hypothetical protein PFFVO_05615 [Plasmodium falciparum Vietnam Oak-Knoll (FVO)]|uniref:Uncharacterized protein n=1 Tax=Plasmodium falciparum Vietnam Oak-Knoll (FVO) TaxID=1036723 RepID=A0A024UXK8_PLAFA|nr:hypothetical protein PFFVO_05615 [Plasmodium falciparum Vietnam Oak-Knoll (FVO)]